MQAAEKTHDVKYSNFGARLLAAVRILVSKRTGLMSIFCFLLDALSGLSWAFPARRTQYPKARHTNKVAKR